MFNLDRVIAAAAVTALAALCAAFLPQAAQAAGADAGALSVTLQYRNTDLDSSQGVAALYRRIRGAATSVCRPFESSLLEGKAVWSECYSHAVANAVQSIHNETLTDYHWQQIRGWKQPRIGAPTSLAAR
jgi:UrcA family protein